MISWAPMTDLIPEGKSGNAQIEHFIVNAQDSLSTKLRAMQHPREFVQAGSYCRLMIDGAVVMSDTDQEKRENAAIVAMAHGKILIGGLSMGMILYPILSNPLTTSVTVIEKNPDVVKLVFAPERFPNDQKLTIITDDIFNWTPPTVDKFNLIYFNIWTNLSVDNLVGLTKLKRRFSRYLDRTDPKAKMFGWEEDNLRDIARQERRRERAFNW